MINFTIRVIRIKNFSYTEMNTQYPEYTLLKY